MSADSLVGQIIARGGHAALAALTPEQLRHLRRTWRAWARPEQLPPAGQWRTWYVRGGRGSGKSRTGSETLATWIRNPKHRHRNWAIIAPTAGDAHKKCVNGPSGIRGPLEAHGLLATGRWDKDYRISDGEIHLKGGKSVIALDGADDAALRIQGYNLAGGWCDEIALWRVVQKRPTEQQPWFRAWFESLKFAVRFAPGLVVATGTPKRGHPLVRMLLNDRRVAKTHMRTADNAANLDHDTVAEYYETFAGTALERQELEGEFLDEVQGALWDLTTIERHRWPAGAAVPEFERIVVAIDPAVSYEEDSDLTGIAVAALGVDGDVYVLGDLSVRCRPRDWLSRAVAAYQGHRADLIVGEKNNGGKIIEDLLRTLPAGETAAYKEVWASQGKRTRAEPVSMLYEQGRVHHVGSWPDLEDEMTTWVPGSTAVSPNRVDALVWAVTELAIGGSIVGKFERVAAPYKSHTLMDEEL